MCYEIPCGHKASISDDIIAHTLNCQWTNGKTTLKIRQKVLDETTGKCVYKSIHFGIKVEDVIKRINDGDKINVDTVSGKLRFKRNTSAVEYRNIHPGCM